MNRRIRTTCPYCGVGCGVELQVRNPITVTGDRQHPANQGRLCAKGLALGETLDLEGRLLEPRIQGRTAPWDTALDAVARGFSQIIQRYGPNAVACYVSGQLLTEDYYVANKLMKGFIGSAHIDTNSRLCMASSVAGHKRAFGSDTVPGNYEDLEQAELLVLAGSNLAWCHPVLYQRIVQARREKSRPKLVVIDPRRTATCDQADLHLPLKPGTDTILFNGLQVYLHDRQGIDRAYLDDHTEGYEAALAMARITAASVTEVARGCDLDEAAVERFYRWFAATPSTVTVYSQGVNQSSYGSDKVNAIINCHLATGRIGRPGSGPFSVTGQPNAMGGREVGGLANQLAAHMDFTPENIDRLARFWKAPQMAGQPGLKAVDLFRAVGEGRIKALWIMATNPVVSLPDADAVKAALKNCELVVVSDVVATSDTVDQAHIQLPALAWGEKDGTVTNSERRISRQRTLLPAPGLARPDWWIISRVAQRMGYREAFDYAHPAQIFREHAALSGFENQGRRAFDIGGLADLSDADYDTLEPVQWPVPVRHHRGTTRLFGDGRFLTESGRGRFIPVGERRPVHGVDAIYPLVLNTGRIRDQWHTMTRTGKSPRLSGSVPEPCAELHPEDAAALAIVDGALVQVTSHWGTAVVRACISAAQQSGSVFVPMHWGHPFARTGRIDAVVNPMTDPLSGQPESKHTPVNIVSYQPRWQGFLLTRRALDADILASFDYWVASRSRQCWRYEIAGEQAPPDWDQWIQSFVVSDNFQQSERLNYQDAAAGRYRSAGVVRGRLDYCLCIAPNHALPPRDWLLGLFERDHLDEKERRALLSGRPPQGGQDAGRTVCVCFGVGINRILTAIHERNLTTPEAIGAELRAGTNCGSCVPELRALIQRARTGQAA